MVSERLLLTLLLAVCVVFAAQPASAEHPDLPFTQGPLVVRATLVTPGDGVFRSTPSSRGVLEPNHPPISEIDEMPLPDHLPGVPLPDKSAVVLRHEVVTGETIEISTWPAAGEGGSTHGWRGPVSPGRRPPPTKDFSDFVEVPDTSIHPWRMVVKLVIKFIDVDGVGRFTRCSGAMIDAETVLTAGHCVWSYGWYDDNQNFIEVRDWADEIWVYPGWDGDLDDVDSNLRPLDSMGRVVDPFGYGYAETFATEADWIISQDSNADRGLIRINRAVGMLTGWFGTTWGDSCGTITSRIYHNASYPSEYCGLPGMHNGTRMWYWLGTIDECPGDRLTVYTSGGCYNSPFKGMSGSPLWRIEVDEMLIHGVATSGSADVPLPYLDYTRNTEDWSDYLNGLFIPGSRGDDFDLQALDANGPPGLQAGSRLDDFSFVAANPTDASSSGAWSFNVYLSTDYLIDHSDTFLGRYTSTRPWTPMDSISVEPDPAPVVPIGTPLALEGYWVGVVLDPATDLEPSNNATQGWDAHHVSVFPVSDVVAEWVDVPDGSYDHGQTLAVDLRVLNRGGAESEPLTIEVRASSNEYIGLGDPLLRSFDDPALGPGEVLDVTRQVTIPGTLSDGDWYIGILVHTDDDHDESNNRALDTDPIHIGSSEIFADGFESGNTSGWS